MTELYDVIIVGAGPAGAVAAKFAGENGLKTALLERKIDIRTIRRICTMIIGIDEEGFGEYLTYNRRNKRFVFPHNGFSLKYDGPTRNIYGFHILSPCGKRFQLGDVKKAKAEGKPPVALMVDKGYWIQIIVDEARASGVEVFTNVNVNHVRKESDCVVLSDNWGNEYRGKFVIAADGVNSRIGRELGFNKKRVFLGTYRDMARTYEGVEIPESDVLMFCMGWRYSISVSPEITEGHFHVAAASYNVDDKLDEEIDRFLGSEPYASWFRNAREIDHRTSCASNIASPIPVPFKDNVLVIGDASWMQETGNAAAMALGWKAANAVTEALIKGQIDKEGVSSYLEWYDKYYYQPRGKRLASSGGADFKDYLSAEDIDYLVGMVPEPQRATMNAYTIFSTIGPSIVILPPPQKIYLAFKLRQLFSKNRPHNMSNNCKGLV